MTWNESKPALANQISADIPDIWENTDELRDIIEAITNGTVGTTASGDFKADALVLELQNIWFSGNDVWTITTNGALFSSNEYATNDIMMRFHAFDGATEEFVAINIAMPEGWDRGTIKAKFYWTGASGCSAGDTVEWKIAAGALSDDDAIDAALGTLQVISDTVLAGVDGDMHITAATPAITVGGSPALGDLIHFKISRNVSGTDDMTEDAWLFGVMLQITTDKDVAAW